MSCPYKYVLGIPGEGFHSTRIFGYALYDFLGTIALAMITSMIFNTYFILDFIIWFVVGEVLHYLYGTQTAFLTTMGIDACPEKN
jgi:hypothetical protein